MLARKEHRQRHHLNEVLMYKPSRMTIKFNMNTFSSLFVITLLSILTSTAQAWSMWELNGAKMDIDGKDIRVASVKTVGDDYIFHSKDATQQSGIYVVATLNESSSQSLPRTTSFIREYLKSRGFNVSDKPDGCSKGIKFYVSDLNIDDPSTNLAVEESAQPKSLSDLSTDLTNTAISLEGAKAVAKINGVFVGALAFSLSQPGHYEGNELVINGSIFDEPTYEKMGENSFQYIKERDGITARTSAKNSDPNTTTADLLTLMTKVWVDKYFVKD